MAMVGTVVMTAPRANDLHGFLAKANLERFCYRLEHELKLDSVSRLRELNDFSDLVQLGMSKKDIGSLRKQLKRVDHPSGGTFSLLRNKAKPVKTVSTDVQVPPPTGRTTQPAATLSIGNRLIPENVGRCSSCAEKSSGVSAKGNNVCNKCQSIPRSEHSATNAKRGSLKRSMSAATDHVPSCHPINRVHSTTHPSCVNGQRLALWHDERGNSEASKRFSLRGEDSRTRTPTGKSPTDKREPKSAPPLTDVLTVLAGPPPFPRSSEVPNPPTLTDRSPLIEMDKPSFGNSFDNIAASDSGSISRSSSGVVLVPESAGKGEPVQTFQKLPAAAARHSDGKRRKWFPQLRVKIPEDDNARLSSKLNIKKLSASEERKIDEALELAGTFARLGTTEHLTSTPRTPGASSKESKESLSSSAESPTTPHFRFALFKSRKEEKKSFAEELASHLTHPGDVLTPEALDAYEKLVSMGGLDEGEDTPKVRQQKQTTRLAHRLSLRVKFSRHVHPNRSSLSESDKSAMPPKQLETSPPGGRGRSVRFGSTGRTLKNLSSAGDEHNLFGWFDRNPLNSTTTTKQGASPARPKSLQSNFTFDNRFPLSMPPPPPQQSQQTPPIRTAGKESGVLPTRAESVRRSPPPLPSSTTVEFCPPPAVPPRVPLRQSTVNTKPRQRNYPLPSGSTPDKQRSYSEGTGGAAAAAASHPDGGPRLNLPRHRGDIRSSTDDDHHSSSSEPHSPTTSRQLDHTHGGSDDSVFDQRSPGAAGGTGCLGQHRSLSAKNVKVNVEQLGFSDKNDPFWVKNVTLDLCHSESDLLREALTPIPGRYETSDCISYEDLMEFALENRSSDVCDEIRVMRKMFSNEVPVADCMDALVETSWDIHSAVKLIRLKRLLNAGLGTQEQCKEALMASNWNVDEAASFLLSSSCE